MTYSDLLSRLYNKKNHKNKPPAPIPTPYSCIHIAGSNGKGTAAWKIAESLRAAGFKTGLFTSPHISSFRERIQIDGKLISEEDVVRLLQNTIDNDAGFFEIATKMALTYFAERKVDFAVIEAGLGGEFDATSAVTPILSVITSLSLEHTEILGGTLAEIAKAKAGILKRGVPVILGPNVPKELIEPYARKLLCPIFQGSDAAELALKKLSIPLVNSLPPCRMEIIPHPARTILLDVAHNPGALEYLFRQIKTAFPGRQLRCLFSLSKKKPIVACVKEIAKASQNPALYDCPHPRLYPADALKREARIDLPVYRGVHDFIESSNEDELLVVCGSFFIMSEIRKQLGINEISDPPHLNEKLLRL